MSAKELAPTVLRRPRGRKPMGGKLFARCPENDVRLVAEVAARLDVNESDVIYTGTMLYVRQVLEAA